MRWAKFSEPRNPSTDNIHGTSVYPINLGISLVQPSSQPGQWRMCWEAELWHLAGAKMLSEAMHAGSRRGSFTPKATNTYAPAASRQIENISNLDIHSEGIAIPNFPNIQLK